MPMDNEYFQDWLSVIDNLGDAQRAEAEAVLLGRCEAVSSLAAVELAADDDRCCPHCERTRCSITGQGTWPAPLSVQELSAHIQRGHRHPLVRTSLQKIAG